MMKKAIKYVSALCLIMVVAVMMTACGGGNDNDIPNQDDIKNQILALKNSVQGIYVNVDDDTDMYYIYDENYSHRIVNISETKNKNDMHTVIMKSVSGDYDSTYHDTIKLFFGTKVVSKDRTKIGYDKIKFIDTTKKENGNVTNKFTDEDGKTYKKISSLTEFLYQIEPNIDFTDMTDVPKFWQDLFNA